MATPATISEAFARQLAAILDGTGEEGEYAAGWHAVQATRALMEHHRPAMSVALAIADEVLGRYAASASAAAAVEWVHELARPAYLAEPRSFHEAERSINAVMPFLRVGDGAVPWSAAVACALVGGWACRLSQASAQLGAQVAITARNLCTVASTTAEVEGNAAEVTCAVALSAMVAVASFWARRRKKQRWQAELVAVVTGAALDHLQPGAHATVAHAAAVGLGVLLSSTPHLLHEVEAVRALLAASAQSDAMSASFSQRLLGTASALVKDKDESAGAVVLLAVLARDLWRKLLPIAPASALELVRALRPVVAGDARSITRQLAEALLLDFVDEACARHRRLCAQDPSGSEGLQLVQSLQAGGPGGLSAERLDCAEAVFLSMSTVSSG